MSVAGHVGIGSIVIAVALVIGSGAPGARRRRRTSCLPRSARTTRRSSIRAPSRSRLRSEEPAGVPDVRVAAAIEVVDLRDPTNPSLDRSSISRRGAARRARDERGRARGCRRRSPAEGAGRHRARQGGFLRCLRGPSQRRHRRRAARHADLHARTAARASPPTRESRSTTTPFDPEGSVSIIDMRAAPSALTQADVTIAGFTAFNAPAAIDPRIRIFGPGATVAQDLEPEYIAVSHDSQTAWVTLQENNALAIVDLQSRAVTSSSRSASRITAGRARASTETIASAEQHRALARARHVHARRDRGVPQLGPDVSRHRERGRRPRLRGLNAPKSGIKKTCRSASRP